MILDELGYLPFSASGGALLIHTDHARLPASQTMIDRDGHLSYRESQKRCQILYPACDNHPISLESLSPRRYWAIGKAPKSLV